MKREVKYNFYGEHVVMQKGDDYDFPVAMFLDESEAEEYVSKSPTQRYIVAISKIIKLLELKEEE